MTAERLQEIAHHAERNRHVPQEMALELVKAVKDERLCRLQLGACFGELLHVLEPHMPDEFRALVQRAKSAARKAGEP